MSSSVSAGAAAIRSAELASLKQSSSAPALRRRSSVHTFRSLVWNYWGENGRHDLPWRKTKDPYRILISEVMLQQTQVDRVIPKYKDFLRAFPNNRMLAKASLADILKVWSGLGYNRRAKFLRDAAIAMVERHSGKVPREYAELVELPGVGDYTARAVRVFAFNEPDVLIETNIRTAFIHHFHSNILQDVSISDAELIPFATLAAEGQGSRQWHSALMDYGAHLKRSGVRNNHKSTHYTKQSKFEGSLRQLRGAILRELTKTGRLKLPNSGALDSLARDGLITNQKGKWRIA